MPTAIVNRILYYNETKYAKLYLCKITNILYIFILIIINHVDKNNQNNIIFIFI